MTTRDWNKLDRYITSLQYNFLTDSKCFVRPCSFFWRFIPCIARLLVLQNQQFAIEQSLTLVPLYNKEMIVLTRCQVVLVRALALRQVFVAWCLSFTGGCGSPYYNVLHSMNVRYRMFLVHDIHAMQYIAALAAVLPLSGTLNDFIDSKYNLSQNVMF